MEEQPSAKNFNVEDMETRTKYLTWILVMMGREL